MSNEDYSNGKIIITWTLSNNATISSEINIGAIEVGDVFKILFPGTDVEAALVVSTKVTLSFNEGAIFTEDTFPGFVELLKCKLMNNDNWIIWE